MAQHDRAALLTLPRSVQSVPIPIIFIDTGSEGRAWLRKSASLLSMDTTTSTSTILNDMLVETKRSTTEVTSLWLEGIAYGYRFRLAGCPVGIQGRPGA